MPHPVRNRSTLAAATLAFSTQLTVRRALAHAAHSEDAHVGQTEAAVEGEQSTLPPASAAAETVSTPDKADSDAAVPVAEDETTIREVPASQQPAPISKAGIPDGFSFGLGESLLAIIITGPLLLHALKK